MNIIRHSQISYWHCCLCYLDEYSWALCFGQSSCYAFISLSGTDLSVKDSDRRQKSKTQTIQNLMFCVYMDSVKRKKSWKLTCNQRIILTLSHWGYYKNWSNVDQNCTCCHMSLFFSAPLFKYLFNFSITSMMSVSRRITIPRLVAFPRLRI